MQQQSIHSYPGEILYNVEFVHMWCWHSKWVESVEVAHEQD